MTGSKRGAGHWMFPSYIEGEVEHVPWRQASYAGRIGTAPHEVSKLLLRFSVFRCSQSIQGFCVSLPPLGGPVLESNPPILASGRGTTSRKRKADLIPQFSEAMRWVCLVSSVAFRRTKVGPILLMDEKSKKGL